MKFAYIYLTELGSLTTLPGTASAKKHQLCKIISLPPNNHGKKNSYKQTNEMFNRRVPVTHQEDCKECHQTSTNSWKISIFTNVVEFIVNLSVILLQRWCPADERTQSNAVANVVCSITDDR